MQPVVLTLIAIGSIIVLAVLAYLDPKKNRRFRDQSWVGPARATMLLLLLLPGVPLTMQGGLPMFLVWIGGVTIFGWTVAFLANMLNPEN